MTITIVFDNNIAPSVARSLHPHVERLGHVAVHLKDRFPQDIPDLDLFRALAPARSHILVTVDRKQTKRTAEREALLASGILGAYLPPSVEKWRPARQAALVLWHFEDLLLRRRSQAGGLILFPASFGPRAVFKRL